jgi:hypothetical protein
MSHYLAHVLAAHTGFEPAFPGLKVRFPKPLEECATEFGHSTENRTPIYTLRGCRPSR